ncbi:MAG: hypothetical protein HQL22_06485 [Candidatus Omnitrophica bacterium]|nr:hypothetical protein [Candidatus Omnitrophota bacterium]
MEQSTIMQWLVSIVIPVIITEFIRRQINHRGPKLIYYSGEVITHRILPKVNQGDVQQSQNIPAPQPVWLNSLIITIRNNGNTAAKNVEVSHPQAPEHYQLAPAIQHTVVRSDDGRRMTIQIPSIAPKETVAISYLFGTIANWNDVLEYVRSDEGHAEKINVILNRVFSMWFNIMVLGFCLLGIVFLGVIIWWLYLPAVFGIKWLIHFPRG